MKGAVIKIEGTQEYLVLLPDHTVKKATTEVLLHILTDFSRLDETPEMKNGEFGKWNKDDPVLHKGKIYAYVTDDDTLVMYDFAPFRAVLQVPRETKYISVSEYARKYGKSVEQIKVFCQNGRIKGATKLTPRAWAIPEDAAYPADERFTAGKMYDEETVLAFEVKDES